MTIESDAALKNRDRRLARWAGLLQVHIDALDAPGFAATLAGVAPEDLGPLFEVQNMSPHRSASSEATSDALRDRLDRAYKACPPVGARRGAAQDALRAMLRATIARGLSPEAHPELLHIPARNLSDWLVEELAAGGWTTGLTVASAALRATTLGGFGTAADQTLVRLAGVIRPTEYGQAASLLACAFFWSDNAPEVTRLIASLDAPWRAKFVTRIVNSLEVAARAAKKEDIQIVDMRKLGDVLMATGVEVDDLPQLFAALPGRFASQVQAYVQERILDARVAPASGTRHRI